ncbi:MAG: gas vesicle protein K [Gemmatimonadetes bacterium]|nr:gas vesicle protein K [Gemmatimonadota bacterium]
MRAVAPSLPERLETDENDIEAGVAKLVLTLVEFIRQVLEHQAIRRMEGGSLSDEEVERLGLALLRLEERLDDVKEVFGLADEDLNVDLGPLGRLL